MCMLCYCAGAFVQLAVTPLLCCDIRSMPSVPLRVEPEAPLIPRSGALSIADLIASGRGPKTALCARAR